MQKDGSEVNSVSTDPTFNLDDEDGLAFSVGDVEEDGAICLDFSSKPSGNHIEDKGLKDFVGSADLCCDGDGDKRIFVTRSSKPVPTKEDNSKCKVCVKAFKDDNEYYIICMSCNRRVCEDCSASYGTERDNNDVSLTFLKRSIFWVIFFST